MGRRQIVRWTATAALACSLTVEGPAWGEARTATPPVVATAATHEGAVRRLDQAPPGWRRIAVRPLGDDRALVRRVHRRWWGTEIVLRRRVLRRVNDAITMGAGVAGVVSVLAAAGVISGPAAIPGGVIAAVLTLGRAALEICNWNNKGVRIIVPRLAPVATCLPR